MTSMASVTFTHLAADMQIDSLFSSPSRTPNIIPADSAGFRDRNIAPAPLVGASMVTGPSFLVEDDEDEVPVERHEVMKDDEGREWKRAQRGGGERKGGSKRTPAQDQDREEEETDAEQ